ncbi:MAG: hypothetical protein ACE5H1_04880 [Thermodesulfobacteriota bacterium]
MDRPLKPRPTIEEVNKTVRKAYGKCYCLHPDSVKGTCEGGIVKAHTIQSSGGLSKIVDSSNHVYQFSPYPFKLQPSSFIEPNSIGINKASTFTGFCQIHDTKTFERIETQPFSAEKDQIFLLAYRALSRRLFMYRNDVVVTELMKKWVEGLTPIEQAFAASYSSAGDLETKIYERQKGKYDKILQNGDYSLLKYYVVFIDTIPEFLCSGSLILETDFSGRRYYQPDSKEIDLKIITFSIIPIDDGGAIVYASIDEGTDIQPFFKSIINLDKHLLPNAITRYTFEYHEDNTFLSPIWWNKLDNLTKNAISKRALSDNIESGEMRPDDCLSDDGYNIVKWNITKIMSNCF